MQPIAVYATCPWCEGHGRIALQPGGARTETCTECRGLGFVSTTEGRAIIGLIKIAGLDELLPDADAS